MIRLKTKLVLFNMLSKLIFTALFLIFLPYIIERINLRQIDNYLVQKREQVIDLISRIGIEPFITSDSTDAFGSYNILKEEFISLERIFNEEHLNHIEIARRLIDEEEIDYRVLNYSFMIDGQMYLLEVGKSLTSIQYAKQNIKKVILVFLILFIIITLLTELQYTRQILRPLEKITGKLKKIADPSGYDKRPVRTTTSDFLRLDNALRELMENIGELFRKEKEITVNISHELLTPVSVLRSKLENLLLREEIDPDIASKVDESLKTLHRLQSLVNSMLFIARIESHQYLREDDFSLKEVLKDIVSEISPVAEDKGLKLKEEFDQDYRFKEANRSLIFSMFYNIVNNAVKNTPAGGTVTVNGVGWHNRFSITVSDTGRGMTEAQLKTLFLRFKSRANSDEEGTGIGLAIARTIADLHQITIEVTSEIDKGTNFTFTFPENS